MKLSTSSLRSPVRALATWALSALLVGIAAGEALAAGSADIVISQVYGGSGNASAVYKNDFVELFNRGTAAVSIGGWSVQYASAAGSSWAVTNLTGSIQPGQHYLVQEAQGAGGTTNLPTPDVTGNIAMSATTGKVALVTDTTALTSSTPLPNSAIRDFVGFGSPTASSAYEGTGAVPQLSNTTAALRNSNGCTDTDVNLADFTVTAPNPRNSASTFTTCGPTATQVRVETAAGGSGTVVPAQSLAVGSSFTVYAVSRRFGNSAELHRDCQRHLGGFSGQPANRLRSARLGGGRRPVLRPVRHCQLWTESVFHQQRSIGRHSRGFNRDCGGPGHDDDHRHAAG
jgi:hypothetical protein